MHISEIQTRNTNPNITIVLPGTCQARCEFCEWKEEPNSGDFVKNLIKMLEMKPKEFKQVSISGGEPMISPVLPAVMAVLQSFKVMGKLEKVVLTTNGIHLSTVESLLGVDHVNISRHSHDEEINSSIFKTTHIPSAEQLLKAVNMLKQQNIDVTYNCVLGDFNNDMSVNDFIEFMDNTGVEKVSFRNQYSDYTVPDIEVELFRQGLTPIIEHECPACKTTIYEYLGKRIKFHRSEREPSDVIDDVYELILQQNGKLTTDWAGKREIDLSLNHKPVAKESKPSKPRASYSSCGRYSSCGS